jgi:hypothetical protein
MKKFILFALMLSLAGIIRAQTLDEVINKHIEAMGGLEKLHSLKTFYSEGVIVSQNGMEITVSVWKDNDKLFRREMNFGMGTGVLLITDKGGWNTDRQGGFVPMKEEQYHRQLYQMDCAGPLVDYAAKGHKAEWMGKVTLEGKEYYKIKLTLKYGMEQNYFIDPVTYYIDKVSFKAGGAGMGGGPGMNPDAEIVVSYSNYTKTPEGYVFPYTTTTSGGFGGSLNIEKLEVNKPIDESKYKPQ